MVIQTSCGHFYSVIDTFDANLSHVWYGLPVKKVKGVWLHKTSKKGVKIELVRKEATRLIEATP
jgi:uncharacterized membrane protein